MATLCNEKVVSLLTQQDVILPVFSEDDRLGKKIPGRVAFLTEKDLLFPIYCDGHVWRNFTTHSIIKEAHDEDQ